MARRMTTDEAIVFKEMIQSHQHIIEYENKFDLAEADRLRWEKEYAPVTAGHQRANDAQRKSETHMLDQLYQNFYQLFIDMPMVMQGAPYHQYD